MIKSPIIIDREIEAQGMFFGDCDDAAGYLAALLKSIGFRVFFVVTAPSKTLSGEFLESKDFSHIFTRILLDSSVINLDVTSQAEPGWSAPSHREREFLV